MVDKFNLLANASFGGPKPSNAAERYMVKNIEDQVGENLPRAVEEYQ